MGQLVGIFTASEKAQPLTSVAEVRAIAGVGLEGDRYATRQGTFWKPNKPDREVTLIERESVEAVARDYKIEVRPEALRRNLLTTGVALNHLVGRRLQIGEVTLEGIELCEPCKHLDALTGIDAQKALRHRGGLRARIVQGGLLKVGDAITCE